MRRLRGWMPKSDTALRPCFWILCAAFGLGILLGQLAGRSLGVEQQDALASYLRRYAALCASAERPVQSALSAVLTYLRGPAAAFLLGLHRNLPDKSHGSPDQRERGSWRPHTGRSRHR